MLVQQEPDASSFPNGGIRNTFEARGYSAWDPTSPAFIVGGTLCIPTVFIAYTGEALDYKVPLLRSISAVNKAATEVCRYFDKEVNRVIQYLGWEQEYFLVDESLWAVRPDLMLTGRTLMGQSEKNFFKLRKLRHNGRSRYLHKTVRKSAENDNLAERRGKARRAQYFPRDGTKRQKPLGSSRNIPFFKKNLGLCHIEHHVVAFAVSAYAGYGDADAVRVKSIEKRIENGCFSRVFAHAGNADAFKALCLSKKIHKKLRYRYFNLSRRVLSTQKKSSVFIC